jgi:hypothetical protein
MQPTIGERIHAAVLGHKLGIATDRALKLYVRGRELHPSWEQLGEALLREESLSAIERRSSRPAPKLDAKN